MSDQMHIKGHWISSYLLSLVYNAMLTVLQMALLWQKANFRPVLKIRSITSYCSECGFIVLLSRNILKNIQNPFAFRWKVLHAVPLARIHQHTIVDAAFWALTILTIFFSFDQRTQRPRFPNTSQMSPGPQEFLHLWMLFIYAFSLAW